MSKKVTDKFNKYLYDNFLKLFNYIDIIDEDLDRKKGLIAYNNIIGSLMGLIDAREHRKDLKSCKEFVLKYYELTYPEDQLEVIEQAIYSKICLERVGYVLKKMPVTDSNLEIVKEFFDAYLKGYNISRDVSLKTILPYYSKKMNEYSYKLSELQKYEKKH